MVLIFRARLTGSGVFLTTFPPFCDLGATSLLGFSTFFATGLVTGFFPAAGLPAAFAPALAAGLAAALAPGLAAALAAGAFFAAGLAGLPAAAGLAAAGLADFAAAAAATLAEA